MGFTVLLILFVLIGSVSAANDNITSLSQDRDNEINQEQISTGNDDSSLKEIKNNENATLKAPVSGGTFADIQEAISSAESGATIELDGLYNGSGTAITIDKNNLTIIGNNAILDAQCQSRIFNITGTGVTLKNIKFINGNATDKGGAIYWYGANGTINNSIFANNKAKQSGGAIQWQGTNGTVTDSYFSNNTAEFNGGAIAIADNGAKIDNAKLINNTAAKFGGAIYVDGADSTISNSELSGNRAADGTDNVAVEAGAGSPLTNNVTSDKGNIITFITEINATSAGDVYQNDKPIVINIKTNAKEGTVSVTVKGKTYNSTVKDGVATISIPDLVAGTYSDVVVSYHDSTGNYIDASDNVTFTVKASKAEIISKDIKKDYNSNYNYNIRIIGADGEPVSGETIKISINGKIKSYKTDSKGDIIIKLGKTYIPGKYTVKLSYKGISSKHVITVKQILKSKKVVKIKKNAKKSSP